MLTLKTVVASLNFGNSFVFYLEVQMLANSPNSQSKSLQQGILSYIIHQYL